MYQRELNFVVLNTDIALCMTMYQIARIEFINYFVINNQSKFDCYWTLINTYLMSHYTVCLKV